jgi:general secretion pathway protein N
MPRALPTARNPASRAPWAWAWAGALLGLLFALIVFAPARWLAATVETASGGQVQLVDATGTVWTGTARLVLSGGAGSRDVAALPGLVRWTLRPGLGALNFQFAADCCTPSPLAARITPAWSGASMRVADGESSWPASVLAGLGTPWNTIQAEGSLRLSTQGLLVSWNAGRMNLAGRAEMTALGMSSRLSTLKPMGSYRLTINGGDAIAMDLGTLEGSLKLSGNGRWVGSRLRFQGEASAAPENEAALSNLLNIIGRRNGARSIITLG